MSKKGNIEELSESALDEEDSDYEKLDEIQRKCDLLNQAQKQRLEELENQIDRSFLGDEEAESQILSLKGKSDKEKLELMSNMTPMGSEAGKPQLSIEMENAFNYENPENLEKINEELRSKFLSVPVGNQIINEDDI